MANFKSNLLAQFSVVTFVIMVILALVISMVLIETLNRNVGLMKEHNVALLAGETIDPSDPISITSLSKQVGNLKWVILAAIGGSFLYLYATLVGMVWGGWRTIVWQRGQLESTNAKLERRVAERVEQHKEALEQGRRRLDAFRKAASRLALEEVPERALQELVHVSKDLVGARYGVLALLDPDGPRGKVLTSGFPPEQEGRFASPAVSIEDLGLKPEGARGVAVGDERRLLSAHGFAPRQSAIQGFLGVAVMVLGRTAGAFYLMEKEDGSGFDDDDEELLNLFAVLAGVHFENVGLYEEVGQERRKLAAIQGSMIEGLIVLDSSGKARSDPGQAAKAAPRGISVRHSRRAGLQHDRPPGKGHHRAEGPPGASRRVRIHRLPRAQDTHDHDHGVFRASAGQRDARAVSARVAGQDTSK